MFFKGIAFIDARAVPKPPHHTLFILFHTITTFPNFAPSLKTVKKRTYFCTRPASACRKKEKFLNTPAFPCLRGFRPAEKKT